MAILYSYPLGTPERTDLIIGTKMASSYTDDLPITQNYSIGALIDMVATTTGAQTFNAVANVGAGVAGGNTTTNLITFSPVHVKGSLKDSLSAIGTSGQLLSSTGSAIKWIDAPTTGVTSVTGTAPIVSSGGNTPAISLANTTVTAGVYTNTNLTVDAQGRITAAASGTLGGVTKIIAGTRISISPTGGTGDVTITADADTVTSLTTTGTSGVSTLSSGVLNIPNYANTGALSISTAVNSSGTWTTPLSAAAIDGSRDIALTSNVFAGGTKVGYVPSGGTSSLYLKGDGTWASIPTGLQFKGTWDASGGSGGSPDLTDANNQGDGFLWITSVAGTAYPNGGAAAPSTWNLGDWAVYVGAAGSGTWTRVPATNAGVTSFVADSTNSSYLTMTPTTASTGAVELDADLSATAVSGSIDSTKFLRGDNKWAVPSYTTDTNTTYSIASADTTVISLTAASPAGAAGAITLAASGAASVSGSSNTITIGATDTNTTYDFLAIETIPTFTLNTTTNTGYTTAVNLATTVAPAGGTGMTVDITASNGNVTAVVINKPGSGYAVGDAVTVVQSGSSGDAIITLSGSTGNVNPNLRLIDQAFGFDDVKLVGGANVTITRNSDNQVTFVGQNDNTQNIYTNSWQQSTNDIILRKVLTGAGSGTQDIKIVKGNNITFTYNDADNFTITATNTTYTAGTGLTLSGTVFSADVDATQANDDTVALSAIADRFYGVQLDNNTTVADAKLVVNIPWTDTMGAGFTVSAGTNTAATTITAGDTLTLAEGTNITTVSDPDGTITINSTDQYTGTVEDVALTHYGDAFTIGITDPQGPDVAIAITQKVGATAADYINGLGNIAAFPTIPTGTVTSVDCSISGDAYTATVTDPNVDAVIAIAPQGDATQYINGAGDLTLLSTLPQGIVESLTTTGTSGAATLVSGVLNVPQYSESDTLLSVTQRGASTSVATNFTGSLTVNGSGAGAYFYVSGNAGGTPTPTNTQGMAFAYNNSNGAAENKLYFNPGSTTASANNGKFFAIVNQYMDSANSNARSTEVNVAKFYGDGDMDIPGTFTAGGDVVAYSDERLKSNVKTLDGSKVYDMHGVSFDKDGKKGSGVIAQELEKVAPELIHDEGEYKAVAYGNISGYLIEAIKDLKAEIEELKKQIK